MKKLFKTVFCLLSFIFFSTLPALSDDSFGVSTYDFSPGGNCTVNGEWSQVALQHSNQILLTIESLKDDKNCLGFAAIYQSLKDKQAKLLVEKTKIPPGTPARPNTPTEKNSKRLRSLPSELNALRTVWKTMSGSGNVWSTVSSLVVDRLLERFTMNDIQDKDPAGSLSPPTDPNASSVPKPDSFDDLLSVINSGAEAGLDIASEVLNQLKSKDLCAVGRPNEVASMINSAIYLTGAYVSGGQVGMISKLTNTIQSLLEVIRTHKFFASAKLIANANLWTSLSCLMESTALQYCSTDDANEILDLRTKLDKQSKNGKDWDANPLAGYYILQRELPLISKWIQKVQFGFEPKLGSDAEAKNAVIQTLNEVIYTDNRLKGVFNEAMITYNALTSAEAKKNHLVGLLTRLVGDLTFVSNGNENFFTKVVPDLRMPFYLIGYDEGSGVPPQCSLQESGGFVQSWNDWMINGNKFQPQFEDTDRLAKVMYERLSSLLSEAMFQASAYYQARLIVDPTNLVADAMTGTYLSPKRSFENLYFYLEGLKRRLMKQIDTSNKIAVGDNPVFMLPQLTDTLMRLEKINSAFDAYARISASNLHISSEEIVKASRDVIQEMFNQFNIVIQKDTFLAIRLKTLVYYDLSQIARNPDLLTPDQHDILMATGENLMNFLVKVNGYNMASQSADISHAMVVNTLNLEALEITFKDVLQAVLADLKMRKNNQQPSQLDLSVDSELRRAADRPLWAWFLSIIPGFDATYEYFIGSEHADAYPTYWYPISSLTNPTRKDDEHHSFQKDWSFICVQTHAFEDVEAFKGLCRTAKLSVPYAEDDPELNLSVSFDDLYQKRFKVETNRISSLVTVPGPTTGERTVRLSPQKEHVCAIRDYLRRNQVYWMKKEFSERN